MSAGQTLGANTLVGDGSAAYSLDHLQALRVSDSGTVRLDPSTAERLSVMLTFKPYVFGQSDPDLRPAVVEP